MNKMTIFFSLALLLGVPVLSGHGTEPKKAEPLMQRKLKHAQTVLEWLAINDFDKIGDSAQELLVIKTGRVESGQNAALCELQQ